MSKPPPIVNRVTEFLGVDYPIVQAPMACRWELHDTITELHETLAGIARAYSERG